MHACSGHQESLWEPFQAELNPQDILTLGIIRKESSGKFPTSGGTYFKTSVLLTVLVPYIVSTSSKCRCYPRVE